MEKYYKGHLCWLKDQGHYDPRDDKDRLIHYAFPQYTIHNETCIKPAPCVLQTLEQFLEGVSLIHIPLYLYTLEIGLHLTSLPFL